MNEHTIRSIARVCHNVNRAYCLALGDTSVSEWELAPEWQRETIIDGVRFHVENPYASPWDSHNNWFKKKEAEGWKYGLVKDADKKEHPCMVPYSQLPTEQRAKDYIFAAVIKELVRNPPVG